MQDPLTEIKKMWRIFATGDDSIIELRALWPKGISNSQPPRVHHFCADAYLSIQECQRAFENRCIALNQEGYNIYTVMNPIRSDFKGPGAAKDVDIQYRDLLLIDIDRSGATDQPSSEEELATSHGLAIDIRAYLNGAGWPKPFTVMSGNGYHLYYPLRLDLGEVECAALVKGMLNAIAAKFNNEQVKVDTGVFNAARITKVPGTIMRKGAASAERPYRMAVVCD